MAQSRHAARAQGAISKLVQQENVLGFPRLHVVIAGTRYPPLPRVFGHDISNYPERTIDISRKGKDKGNDRDKDIITEQEKEEEEEKLAALPMSECEEKKEGTRSINCLQECEEYLPYIGEHLQTVEGKYIAHAGYMASQPEVNEKMRAILIDWLVDVHIQFKLLPETLFLSVNIIDRYLEKAVVRKGEMQLVGVTAMLIASKYEEIYPPETRDFVYISDSAYTKSAILDMEQKILKALEFNLTVTSSRRLLQLYNLHLKTSARTFSLAAYLLELTLIEYKFLKYSPAVRAAAALCLSDRLLNKATMWDSILGERFNCKEASLKGCQKDLVIILQQVDKSSLHALKRKYSQPTYHEVAKIKIGRKSR